jgi:hypothetical protein
MIMSVFVKGNIVETDKNIYKFISPDQAERFIDNMMDMDEESCCLRVAPVSKISKATAPVQMRISGAQGGFSID